MDTLHPGGTALVTGGTGALGSLAAHWLLAAGLSR
jgi:NADPH:quinone reductase-like Zn-dependent oxidoreductase